MRIEIFGANGTTGSEIVKKARYAGHDVVGAVRRPETLADVDGIDVAKIDLSNHASLVSAVRGSDAVVVALGHGGLRSSAKPTSLYSDGIRAIRAAMRDVGVSRIVALSSGGVVEDPQAPWFYRALIRPYLINTYVDLARMEAILEESEDLEWTSVRLTYLLEGKSKPFSAVEGEIGQGSFKIHVVDAARFVVSELTNSQWLRGHPVLGYVPGAAPKQLADVVGQA